MDETTSEASKQGTGGSVVGGDEDWSQHAEADESHFLPSSLRTEAHKEAIRPSSTASNDDDTAGQIHRMTSSLIVEDDVDDMRNPSSIIESSSGTLPSRHHSHHHDAAVDSLDNEDRSTLLPSGLRPQRAERTLKEKLVERERQRRAETERARLKRQFALSSNVEHVGGDEDEDGGSHGGYVDGGSVIRENGSVAGTVGEGNSVAAMTDIEEDDNDDRKLTYPMKRFLQEQGNIIEEEEPTLPRESPRDANNNSKGVVMERFLKEPVVVVASGENENDAVEATAPDEIHQTNAVDRSVSFDMEVNAPVGTISGGVETSGDIPSGVNLSSDLGFSSASAEVAGTSQTQHTDPVDTAAAASLANASLTCLPPGDEEDSGVGDIEAVSNTSAHLGDDVDGNVPSVEIQSVPESPLMDQSTSSDQPRVLRLTEAEIQEMAAIDEASRSNAPPSERDSISDSIVGELVSDFGGHAVDNALSQGTPTTAMESNSIASGNQSTRPMSEDIEDRNSIDELAIASISSHVNVSVTANPPSDIGGDDDVAPSLIRDEIQHGLGNNNDDIPVDVPVPAVSEILLPAAEHPTTEPQESMNFSESVDLQLPGEDCDIVNRQLRPGMINLKRRAAPSDLHAPSTPPIRRTLSAPDSMFDVDGFDFDKNAPPTPDVVQEVGADNMWSPGSRMTASPFPAEKFRHNYGTTPTRKLDDNGIMKPEEIYDRNQSPLLRPGSIYDGETQPLMPQIPKEIVASPAQNRSSSPNKSDGNFIDEAFNLLRSESAFISRDNEIKTYHESSVLQRACSGRMFQLLVTFLVEIPVLVAVVGGSDRLCALVGKWKLHLLLGFLPMCSAISGNMGLESSNLTIRAISEGHVTRNSYWAWVAKEVGASSLLGLTLGGCLGFVSMSLTNYDFTFGVSIMIAQCFSIIIAALNGSLSPLIFTILFKNKYGKWCNQLSTAVQDVFSVAVLFFLMIAMTSRSDVNPADSCTA